MHEHESRTDFIGYQLGEYEAIPALAGLLTSPVEQVKELACEALTNLACVPENRAKIIQAGALPLLLALDMCENKQEAVRYQASRALVGLF